MDYVLRPATSSDKSWLEELRRLVYRDLFNATWGAWDESRHQRHFAESWQAGHISIVDVGGSPIGMLQLFDTAEALEVSEIQIHPSFQDRGIGTRILSDVINDATSGNTTVSLSTGTRNEGAYRLYRRLGFYEARRTDTHIFMVYKRR